MYSGLIALSAIAAVAAWTSPASASEYPWCAYYTGRDGGATNCGFVTYQQCMATISGIGGNCQPNPRYSDARVRTHRSKH
jgi:hypothetical protein